MRKLSILITGMLMTLFACTGNIEVRPENSQAGSNDSITTDLNVQVRGPLEYSVIDKVTFQLYMSPLGQSVKNQQFNLVINAKLDGNIKVGSKWYRLGDYIPISLDSLNQDKELKVIFSPLKQPAAGDYDFTFNVKDKKSEGKERSVSKTISFYNLPDFNFKVRKSGGGSDTLATGDTLRLELYLNQLTKNIETGYQLVISLDDLDGVILFNNTLYRSGDIVQVFYKGLGPQTWPMGIYVRDGTLNRKTSYNLQFSIQDEQLQKKSFAFNVLAK
ncbi:hypothetical protein [Siphonobacter sp. SORGH_AS_1065]|uniref:hypothetical protein n=1 Tax=Siphonobacter sp. SORGH_AS_1065 TaxID=3041795 RepID=UPI002780BA7D|nr:hypothetical protein [Siphonobacter sp. SORGH_AS_1065]MDQ1090472.1 hypothetical protein [Siphonobacter sp. SORGH_AS_1065]